MDALDCLLVYLSSVLLPGLHALHGNLEGFFTLDAKAGHQHGPIKPIQQSPGNVRYLFQWDETNKGNLKIKFMGVVDDHGNNVQTSKSKRFHLCQK
ncbi:unnamed protein product [Adineta ricciae]|uniref:Uncharacterized protein n=1 Tax=Adineta ricciae TaxID=249248 RepID=A0A816DYV9_ADIRI|nr:unnamed protein product [Adineta ricciae]CAF1643146.1 unnamed protein product [Adineta ricciae]